jgi:hypothetical protein
MLTPRAAVIFSGGALFSRPQQLMAERFLEME